MADSTTSNGSADTAPDVTPAPDVAPAAVVDAKTRFGKAIEEARAGTAALRDEATSAASDWQDQATAYATQAKEKSAEYVAQAKEKGAELAKVGKTKASDALAALGQTISGSADAIDEKLGVQYGDYARSAARSIQETAASLEAKDFAELGEDLKETVRKSPALAVGIAAVAGFALARLFTGSDKTDA